MKTAFLFPGQGSQEVGMGHDLFQRSPEFKSLIRCASDYTHEDCEKLCFHGPEKKLFKARFLQPILVAVSLGYFQCVKEQGIRADVVLGHSLGEITSLGACGTVTQEEAVAIAAKRGELMDEAASQCDGTMMAILSFSAEKVHDLLGEINAADRIVFANDNAPNQVIVSGDNATLKKFSELIVHGKQGSCAMLQIAGPWHSPFMQKAQMRFEQWVGAAGIVFKKPELTLILNATATEEKDTEKIKQRIIGQLTHPVFWRQSMEELKTRGIDTVLEIGPGRVLSGLVRANKFPRDTVIYNINNLRGLQRAVDGFAKTGSVSGATTFIQPAAGNTGQAVKKAICRLPVQSDDLQARRAR
jgi:[acyl-carrier-protein] S-malonyltransferase